MSPSTFEIIEDLHAGPHLQVRRALRASDGARVVLKTLRARSREQVARLRREHAVLDTLSLEGVPRALELIHDDEEWTLVLEDFGARSLADLGLAGSMALEELLQLAIELTTIIAELHRQGVIHKDINPSNIVRDPEGRVQLIDFGIATLLPREIAGFVNPVSLEGTLAYIAPEQTGRMNRSLDSRADLYSLGVTLYELATAQLPFEARDALELVHCHIAKDPPAACALRSELPTALSSIIAKLMAKSADDRYQSASGLGADLQRCQDQLRATGSVTDFPLASEDHQRHFRLPRRLYGRKAELERVLEAFERASQGQARLLVVSGPSGIGKSALVHELHRPLTRSRGSFIAGKCAQLSAGSPFSALRQAIAAQVRQVLSEDRQTLERWRGELDAALGSNAEVLLELCPELSALLGARDQPSSASPADQGDRLRQALHDFFSVFARDGHPLCLFLDDLQWTEVETLELVEDLMHSAQHLPLLILAAFRDDEVDEDAPLAVTLTTLERETGRLDRLALSPLSLDDVEALIGDALGMAREQLRPLASVVMDRTGGAPFFVREFLTAMHAQGVISPGQRGWSWDDAKLRQSQVTDNRAAVMSARIDGLSEAARELLAIAACVGDRSSFSTLALAKGVALETIADTLWELLEQELLLPIGQLHSPGELVEQGAALRYRFAHDQLLEAAVAVLGPRRSRTHVEIARRLRARLDDGQVGYSLFDLVEQYELGRVEISEPREQLELAQLERQAARRALNTAAGLPALSHAQIGLELLPDDAWERHYELTRELHMLAVEAAFMSDSSEVFASMTELLLARSRDELDTARLLRWRGEREFAQQQPARALDSYKRALSALGVELPGSPTPDQIARESAAAAEALGALSRAQLLALPECSDPRARLSMEVLQRMISPAVSSVSPLMPVIVGRLMQMSCRHGATPATSYGYIYHGQLLAGAGRYAEACDFGELAVELAQRYDDKKTLGQVYNYAYLFLLHYRHPLYTISPHFRTAHRCSAEAGDRFFIAAAVTTGCVNRLLAGEALGPLAQDMLAGAALFERMRDSFVANNHRVYQQTVQNLSGAVADPLVFTGDFFDEGVHVEAFAGNNEAALGAYYIFKAMLAYLFGDYRAAVAAIEANEPRLPLYLPSFYGPSMCLYQALARLALLDELPVDGRERANALAAVEVDRERLAALHDECPANIAHKLALIDGELARVAGELDGARAAYERALTLAAKTEYHNERALASEVKARFHIELGEFDDARRCLQQARTSYLRWEAFAKVKQLERSYPELLPRSVASDFDARTLSALGTDEHSASALDLAGVLSASQALSREVERGSLLVRLMELVVESAGASAGALMLEREGEWLVEVVHEGPEGTRLTQGTVVLDELEQRGHRSVAASVVRYVARTRETVMLEDARTSSRFTRDPHIERHQIKSVLCLPLARQSGEPGVLYLENRLVSSAFTPARVHILRLLCTQAVISLDNAQLYASLERKVDDRTRELGEKNEQLAKTLGELRSAQARMLVQERLASLGALTAGVAHELRNPLNFINNFARLSQKQLTKLERSLGPEAEAAPDKAKRSLQILELNLGKIVEHGERIDGVVGSMLEHSREDGGGGERVRSDLNRLVEEQLALLRHGIESGERDVDFVLELDPELAPISIVRQELARVIINLVDNACFAASKRHAPADSGERPRVEVRTRATPDAVEIEVRDNGDGVPASLRAKIFEPFFTTKKTGEGTGLGLSLSHEIITQAYGGTLTVESEQGVYAQFLVRLPIRS